MLVGMALPRSVCPTCGLLVRTGRNSIHSDPLRYRWHRNPATAAVCTNSFQLAP